jgi:Arc/MetJ-type ribon-helix-helix transcriptional regulator
MHIPTAFVDEIQRLANAGKYKSRSDFIRQAIQQLIREDVALVYLAGKPLPVKKREEIEKKRVNIMDFRSNRNGELP